MLLYPIGLCVFVLVAGLTIFPDFIFDPFYDVYTDTIPKSAIPAAIGSLIRTLSLLTIILGVICLGTLMSAQLYTISLIRRVNRWRARNEHSRAAEFLANN